MSFDLVAPHYCWMEPVLAGDKLQRARTAHLEHLTSARNVLILGQGPGKFLGPLLRKFPEAEVTCIDSSERMLSLAEKRRRSLNFSRGRTTFIRADVLDYSLGSDAFDLIVTHFFLDCFRPDQLERLIPKIASAAKLDATWLISDFAIPATGFRRMRARAINRLMYTFFRVATKLPARTLTPPDRFLEASGFRLRGRITSNLGLIHSDIWTLGFGRTGIL